jgi:hypothetical protein
MILLLLLAALVAVGVAKVLLCLDLVAVVALAAVLSSKST